MTRAKGRAWRPPPRPLDPKTRIAYENWVQTTASTETLECRVGRHRWPGLTEKALTATEQKNGQWLLEADCDRGCGVALWRIMDADGYIIRSVPRYDYTKTGYLLPTEARSGHGLSSEQKAFMRRELLNRRLKP